MKLIVGLGNPGREYLMTRHNLGFLVIDQLAQKLGVELDKKKFQGLYYKTNEYVLLKPQTYMNNSGECISAFVSYWQIPQKNLLVIYDDIALPLGKFRYREQGSDGGHNGMKNIIEKLGFNKFKRLRVGIGYNSEFLIKDWVLGKFSSYEEEELKKIFPNLVDGLLKWSKEGDFEKVMNKYNSITSSLSFIEEKYLDKPHVRVAIKKNSKEPVLEEWVNCHERRTISELLKIGNYGLRTGKKIGNYYFCALDIDKKGEQFHLSQISYIETSKGIHYYLFLKKLPENVPLFYKGEKIGRIMSSGKQVIGSGSIHQNGIIYRFVEREKTFLKFEDEKQLIGYLKGYGIVLEKL